MKKDVIYIDVEDDITAIIDNMKSSKAKIVALVPPKRSAVLSSVVNSKLLKRAAEDSGKRVVLITNDATLLTIAGGLGLHAAKNLQSKPFIPEAPEIPVLEDNVIEGDLNDLDPSVSVGELDDTTKAIGGAATTGASIDEPIDGKRKFKIPNFERFRLRIVLGAVAVVLLAIFWWWAAFIAPSATVNIVAQTSQLDTAIDYTVDVNVETSDLEKKILKGSTKEMKKIVTEDFTATGEENVGAKATGTITVTNYCYNPGTIGAGTTFTASTGLVFTATQNVPIANAVPIAGSCDGQETTADVPVQARDNGDNYNLAPTSYTVAGISTSDLSGFGGQMSGGTTVIKKVVSQSDFDKAKANFATKDYSTEKQEIADLFGDDLVGMDDTFAFEVGKVTSTPAVGEEGERGIISAEIVFTEVGVTKSDLEVMLKESQEPRIDTSTQSIYDNGLQGATFEQVKNLGGGKNSFRLRTVGIVGPNIDVTALAEQISGKRYSEAKAIVDAIPGVVSSEIKLSPFWVNKVPSVGKTTINTEVSGQLLQ